MKRHLIFSWSASLLLTLALVGCATPLETVKLPGVGPAWQTGRMVDFGAGRGAITELVPVGQELGNWTHRITIEFVEETPLTLEQWMAARRATIESDCPDVTWIVLSHDENALSYEWRVEGCRGHADKHELVRLLRGNDGLHSVSYAEKTERMDPAARAVWLSRLNSAVVVKMEGDDLQEVTFAR
ncbi:MAG: hypothetical protein P8N09_13470 [Planctomycetota bacterium]|jgi:hypothetical protein|nr:hypothetical protein [Planctomycetota bacterium]